MSAISATKAVDFYVAKVNPSLKEIVKSLRELVKNAVPGIEEEIKWGMPVYSKNGLVCSIMSAKAHVSFIFYNGAPLPDPKGIFQKGSGKKMRYVKLTDVKQIKRALFSSWVKLAARQNAVS